VFPQVLEQVFLKCDDRKVLWKKAQTHSS